MTRLLAQWLGVALLLLALPAAADEGASAWVHNPKGDIRLVSAVTATGNSGIVQLGLQFKLQPGWKIYWRSPGDAGYPPHISWKGSDNLASAQVSWPAPRRFTVSGLETVGYEDEVVLPIAARLADPSRPLALRAHVDYLTCENICIPQRADLTLALPTGTAGASPEQHTIGRFLAAVPGDGARAGLSLRAAAATPDGTLRIVVAADPPLREPDIFIERGDGMQFGRPGLRLEDGGRRAVFMVRPEKGTGRGALAGQPLTLTLVDGDRGMEAVATPDAAAAPDRGLLPILGIALLGGLILNLMPCVLPVLSIKLLAMVGHAGAAPRSVRTSFLFSAAGIIASFMILAIAAIAARRAGIAVGWGIQFQQPLFLAGMVVLVTLFAANLFGFYEIPMPRWALGAHYRRGHSSSHLGQFFQGAFATLLATPCSAPFLGTAVGFALARGAPEILGIFATLGVGMSLPYLAAALWPQFARHLPRPGRWMVTLRAILGLALVATAGWLLTVLAGEAGLRAAIAVAVLMAVALAILGGARGIGGRLRWSAVSLLAVGVAAIVIFWNAVPSAASASQSALTGVWRPFDRAAIAGSVAAGKVVFVDVTADWCITCQVNKAAVMQRGPVAERLTSPGVVAMEADWTRPDDGISAYLASFGRYGIPFNAVYGPGAPGGIALPELLTQDAVLQALDRAAKPAS